MANLYFDKTVLDKRLSALPNAARVAFAACCAERLMPTFLRYAQVAAFPDEKVQLFTSGLERIWKSLSGDDPGRDELEETERACCAAIPNENDVWEKAEPYAEDAAAVIIFALRARITERAENAVFAAQRLYEAVDNFVLRQKATSIVSKADEMDILSSNCVQSELLRQERDLSFIEEKADSFGEIEVQFLRTLAKSDSGTVFTEST